MIPQTYISIPTQKKCLHCFNKDKKFTFPHEFRKQNPIKILARINHGLMMICHDNLCLSLANLQKYIEVKRKLRPPISPPIGFKGDGVALKRNLEPTFYVIIGASNCCPTSRCQLFKF